MFQDVASKLVHKLYSISHLAVTNSKFRMSLQEDILRTTNIQFQGNHDKEAGYYGWSVGQGGQHDEGQRVM